MSFLTIAHRGASGHEPENTLAAFEKAIKLGADMIELDVHICKSGEPVVIHDPTLKRTTNGHGRISHKTLKELKTLNAGKNQTIPTLQEALDCIRRRVQVNIELKGPDTAIPVHQVIDEYVHQHQWYYADFLVSSCSEEALRTFHTIQPKVHIGLLISDPQQYPPRIAEELKVYSIHPQYQRMPDQFVAHAHDDGRKVFPYTVNNAQEIVTLYRKGVDGVITDVPDLVQSVFQKHS